MHQNYLKPLAEVNPGIDRSYAEPITVYLASASPRRRQLLHQLGIRHRVIRPDIDETARQDESPQDFVLRMALEKARAGFARVRAEGLALAPVLAADTCIVLDGEIIGKARDRADGIRILQRLAGRSHQVLTGVALVDGDVVQQVMSCSVVVFGPLSVEEIEAYWDSGEPVDKAGAYAIQGKAAAFIERIEGSYSGIVGLPLCEVVNMIKKTGASL